MTSLQNPAQRHEQQHDGADHGEHIRLGLTTDAQLQAFGTRQGEACQTMQHSINDIAVKSAGELREGGHHIDNGDPVEALGVEVVGEQILEPAKNRIERS